MNQLNSQIRARLEWKKVEFASPSKWVRLLTLLLIFSSSSLFGQDRATAPLDDLTLTSADENLATINGVVKDDAGEGLIGVSILVKGTSSGTVTDIDGSYSINVPEGSNTLVNSGAIQDYGLSISGGGDNSRYFVSSNFYKQDGILVSSGYERVNLRANTEFTMGRFKLQQSLAFTRSELERNLWFGRDGSSSAPILRENAPENDGGFEAPNFDDYGFAGLNKYGLASLEDHTETDNKLFGNVSLSYSITDELTAKLSVGADLLDRHNFAFRPTYFMSPSDAVDNVNTENDLTEIRSETLLTLIEPP